MTSEPPVDPMRTYLQEMAAVIDRHGHAVQGVLAEGEHAAFAYTVGLSRDGLAELATAGLPFGVARDVLNAAADLFRADPAAFAAGADVHGLVQGFVMRTREVSDPSALRLAQVFGEPGAPVRAVQLLWPDVTGQFPTADEPSPEQPLL